MPGPHDDGDPCVIIEVPIKCSHCELLYIGCYSCDESYDPESPGWSAPEFFATVPRTIPPTLASPTLMKIAPSFSKIYDETSAAELAGLTELLGAGYRRALEFLVKQYLIFMNPGKTETYENAALRSCIKDHIDDETIKELADKAASVGNDFTHLVYYGNHDIEDLKGLIALVRRWIELKEETRLVRARLISS
jgi:hypothetical protein